jgi:adenylate cyclase
LQRGGNRDVHLVEREIPIEARDADNTAVEAAHNTQGALAMAAGAIGNNRQATWHHLFVSDPMVAALPERVRQIIADEDRASERLIGYVQLTIAAVLWMLYLIAPRPVDAAFAMFAPVPFALSAFTIFSIFRLWLILRQKTPDWFVLISISADVALVLGLIWSFHLQYAHSAAIALKAPTFVYLFVLIVLRALRFDPRYVIAAGIACISGWAALTAAAVAASGHQSITHSFTDYLLSDRILIGAEAEKIFALALVTTLLAIGARRAQRTLVASLREQTALSEVRRFLSKGVADQIAASDHLIEAGQAVERDAAILMLDIRGFTALSMRVPPAGVVRILTSFHARIIPIVRDHGGIIDKFLGDGVMATFGAARVSDSAAADALRALEKILAEAQAWQKTLPALGVNEPLHVNAAVTSGRVVFATLGDGDRLEYTVIGEAVNLAAKLEKHNKVERSIALVTASAMRDGCNQGFVPSFRFIELPGRKVIGVSTALDLNAVAG